jgi:hypothetical protein
VVELKLLNYHSLVMIRLAVTITGMYSTLEPQNFILAIENELQFMNVL